MRRYMCACAWSPASAKQKLRKAHATEILKGHYNLWTAKLLCDVTLCVDGKDFPCHKTILVTSSSYFKAMFTGALSEEKQSKVVLKDVNAATFQELLKFMYTSKLALTENNVHSLLAAANLFQILSAKATCSGYLERQLCNNNCLWIYSLADTYACPDLYKITKDFIISKFSQLVAEEDFLELTSKQLIELISSDMLDIRNEEFLFDCVVRWHSKNPENRSEDFDKILEHVRLPALSPDFLHQRVAQFPAVKNCVKCRGLIDEAEQFFYLPDERMEMRQEWACHR